MLETFPKNMAKVKKDVEKEKAALKK